MKDAFQLLSDFVNHYQDVKLQSTGYQVVTYRGVLYNVEGSSDDPEIGGSWKKLLLRNGITGACYVAAPLPHDSGTSHPSFAVGGHMTPNRMGRVDRGGNCYLMPLCQWHNSTRRNRIAFHLRTQQILELSGYMQGDLYATFLARQADPAPLRLVTLEKGNLIVQKFNSSKRRLLDIPPTEAALLFRRIEENGRVQFVIEDATIPQI